MIAYAVDLKSETIYVMHHLFWQATKAIDGGKASKSITFMPAGKDGDLTAKTATILWTLAPNASDHLYAHTLALRRLKGFLNLLRDAYHYDPGTELEALPFRDPIEASRILLWDKSDDLWSDENDRNNWHSYGYWVRKSENAGWDGLACYAAQPILSTLIPALLSSLRDYWEKVLAGKYYWAHRNPQFLELVYETAKPPTTDRKASVAWAEQYKYNWHTPYLPSAYYVDQARASIPKKKKTEKKPVRRT